MSDIQFAAIDIGSNAVRLLIKSISSEDKNNELKKLLMVRVPIRLGQESFVTGKISDEKFKKLLKLMKAFKHLMSVYEVTEIRACATSAMRDAENSKKIVKDIFKETGIKINIITGQEEAAIIYESHFADSLNKKLNYIYVDVGGGSTEITLIADGELKQSKSYNIGTVRLLNNRVEDKEYVMLQNDLQQIKSKYVISNIIGSGGNIIKLNTLASPKKEAKLTLAKLESVYDVLKKYSVQELMEKYKLRPDRADVITHAASIYIEVAKGLGVENFIVPRIGLSDGIVHLLYENWKIRNESVNLQ
jgi:exopolyphosphatase/guanosine-5'-triphosphate,3'-diphosphate pyrophosphatase